MIENVLIREEKKLFCFFPNLMRRIATVVVLPRDDHDSSCRLCEWGNRLFLHNKIKIEKVTDNS